MTKRLYTSPSCRILTNCSCHVMLPASGSTLDYGDKQQMSNPDEYFDE